MHSTSKTAFPLPLECLQLIVNQLVVDKDIRSLVSLLQVSKYVCLATLPFIYENPFQWIYCRFRQPSLCDKVSEHVSPLVRLFLRSIPEESCTELVRAIYDYEPGQDPPQHWPIDYLSHVRHFQSQDNATHSLLSDSDTRRRLSPAVQDYVDKHALVEKYDEMALGDALDNMRFSRENEPEDSEAGTNIVFEKESELTLVYLNFDIFREATWVLCASILEHLKSIVIPLSDIDRYLDNVGRFRSLASVTFKLDDLSNVYRIALWQMNQDDIQKLEQWQEKRRQDLESAIQFIRQHTVIFGGSLREVLVPMTTYGTSYTQHCETSYLTRMLDLIPSLINPTEINEQNLSQFATKIEQTNVEMVHTIHMHFLGTVWFEMLRSTPFLHRCQSLKRYGTPTLGPDSFRWAVQGLPGVQELGSRPPLEEIWLTANEEPLGNELNDIGQGLGDTLKRFRINGNMYGPEDGAIHPPIRIGHAWRMPVLTILNVCTSYEQLLVDPNLFCHCPSLQIVSLSDQPEEEIVRDGLHMCRAAQLPGLMSLQLGGLPAICFHPDTLHSTKELTTLVLGGPRPFDRYPRPSFLELQEQDHPEHPIAEETGLPTVPPAAWTWDWCLPSLDSLDVHAEFALRFQFKMLVSTPNLRSLCLNLHSRGPLVERELSIADFMIKHPSGDTQNMISYEGKASAEEASVPEPTAGFDLLSKQSADMLDQVLHYLKRLQYLEDCPHHPPSPTFEEPSEPISAWQFNTYTQIRDRELDPLFSAYCGFDDRKTVLTSGVDWRNMKQKEEQSRVDEAIRAIDQYVMAHPNLQSHFQQMLLQQKNYEWKRQKDAAMLKQLAPKVPIVLVPSLQKLVLYGRWIIPEPILGTMFWPIFGNVETLTVHDVEGYGMDVLVKATQASPRLRLVHCLSEVEPGPLCDEVKLKRFFDWPVSPFELETSARVKYLFAEQGFRASRWLYVRDIDSSNQDP